MIAALGAAPAVADAAVAVTWVAQVIVAVPEWAAVTVGADVEVLSYSVAMTMRSPTDTELRAVSANVVPETLLLLATHA
jgi:hypothetical protein